jgi:hypothetical protein
MPYAHLQRQVEEARRDYRTGGSAFWRFERPRPALRKAISLLPRYLITPRVSKHRIFAWADTPTLPDSATFAFSREALDFFGVLHSRPHEVWARAQGTQLRERESGFRYTPSSCFENFPLPRAVPEVRQLIVAAAKELDTLRTNWLNPPEWVRTEVLEFPGAVDGPWARYVYDANPQGIGTVRYPRLVPKDEECAKQLKKRTLTTLYSGQPGSTWFIRSSMQPCLPPTVGPRI